MNEFLIPVAITAVLILINGVYVAAEFAIIGVRKTRMERLSDEGNRVAGGVVNILEHPQVQDRYISTAQLGITIASLGLGMYAEEAFAHLLLGPLHDWVHLSEAAAHTLAVTLALSMLTFIHVVIGEMVPKSLALHYPESAVLGVASLMKYSQKFFGPAVWFLNSIGSFILHLLNVPLVEGGERVHTSEELEMIIDDSYHGGQLDAEEKVMLSRIFDFGEQKVNQVMTPRIRVESYSVDIDRAELLNKLGQSRYSRFPIYEGDPDNVIGILHLKDVVRQQIHEPDGFDLRALVRRAPVVPEYAPVETLLASFKRLHHHMAIVIDEYGGLEGIVTLEDLVEEVVGEVQDEFDQEIAPIRSVGPDEYIVRGDYMLEDLAEISPLEGDLPDVNSVGGLVVALLDRMPQVGDEVKQSGFSFRVESVRGRAVGTVRVRLVENTDSLD
ncbi:MAG: HlyC/CorC family transporter [Anaerolineales bacterium]|nr:HlyC/CorC family transporter [Anaerolineales bacterium]